MKTSFLKKIVRIPFSSGAGVPFKDKGTQALFVTTFFGNVLRLFSNLVLARFLSPEAFAITGLASTIIFAFNMVSDGGFRAFILRHKLGDEDHLLNTLWTVKLIRNLVLAFLMFFLSDQLAAYFGIVDLALVLKVLCFVFIFDGFLPIAYIVIERENKVAMVMYIKFLCTLCSIIFSVVGVYYYNTYWPIIYSMVLNYVLQVLFGYIFVGAKGSALSVDKAIFFEFLDWAKYIIPSSVITLLLMQLDKLVLAKTLTVSELGLYFVAFNFSSAAAAFSIQYSRSVLQPYMSVIYRISPNQFLEKYYAKKMFISIAAAFSFGALSGGSFIFFDLLYDDRYLSASIYLSILLMMPIVALVTYSSEISLLLHGQLRVTLIANIIRLVWFLLAAWSGYLWFGVLGVLCAIGLMEVMPAIFMIFQLKRINLVNVTKELLIILSAICGFGLAKLMVSFFAN
ncbi:MAG: lipopolysaccharide exporter [Candidatus Endobugula sp.]|jgi:lipopolysaccharide exporter